MFNQILQQPNIPSFHKLKFRKTMPWFIPLNPCKQDATASSSGLWSINEVERTNDLYNDNLPLIPGTELGKLQILLHCQPLKKNALLNNFVIGLHEHGTLSLLAMPKVGNYIRLCEILSGAATQNDLDALITDTPPSDKAFFQFLPQKGSDPRARVCLIVQNTELDAAKKVTSFFMAISQFTPLSEEMFQLINSLTRQLEVTTEPFLWQLEANYPKVERLELFRTYPNQIPDIVTRKDIILFPKTAIGEFPTRIPDIHLAVLGQDIEMLKAMLKREPDAIYHRDAYGRLAIELALHTTQSYMGTLIYQIWHNLPRPKQFVTQIFIETANTFTTQEHNMRGIDDDTITRSAIKHYFSDSLPRLENPLAIHDAIQSNNQSKLDDLTTAELQPWYQLRELINKQELPEAKHLFATLLSEKFDIFTAMLIGDWEHILTILEENLPETDSYGNQEIGGNDQDRERRIYLRTQNINIFLDLHYREILKEKFLAILFDGKDKNAPDFIILMKDEIQQLKLVISQDQDIQNKFLELFQEEMTLFMQILAAIESNDLGFLKKILTHRHKGCDFRRHPLENVGGGYIFKPIKPKVVYEKVFNGSLMPEYSELYFALFLGDLGKAREYVDKHILKQEQVLANIQTIDLAKTYYESTLPLQPQQHKDIINGKMPPIAEFVAEKATFDAYKTDVHDIIANACQQIKTYFDSIDKCELEKVYTCNKADYQYNLHHILWYHIKDIVICQTGLECNRNAFKAIAELYTQSETEKQKLIVLFEPVLVIKTKMLALLLARTKVYRKHCRCDDDVLYEIHTKLLFNQISSILYRDILNIERDTQLDVFLRTRIERVYEEQPQKYMLQLNQLHASNGCLATHDEFCNSLIKCNLLSYEQQDPWGYTMLLYAIIFDHVNIVKAFFEYELVSDWIMPLGRRDLDYYTLLSNVWSRSMATLLLHYYTDPNSVICDHEGLDSMLWVYLFYSHSVEDTPDIYDQTLLDSIIAGYTHYPNYLKTVLKFRKDIISYDESVPQDVREILKKHNRSIIRREKKNNRRPKIINVSGLKTFFHDDDGDFYSIYKSTSDLLEAEKPVLTEIFKASFEMDDARYVSEEEYFQETVLTNPNYIFEIFYQHNDAKPIGFYCFQLKLVNSQKSGSYLFMHLSKAACAPDYANRGLLGTSFRILLAVKRYTDDLGIPFKAYGRFLRPALGYLMFDDDGMDASVKYHRDPEILQDIVGEFGDRLESDGSSFPSIQSRGDFDANSSNRAQGFYFLLDECLHPKDEKAALPLVIEVDEIFCKRLRKKLASCGLKDSYLEPLFAAIPNWLCKKITTKS